MSFYKGTFMFRNDSGASRSESLYSSSTSTTLSNMIQKMRQLAPLRMKLSYGPQDLTGSPIKPTPPSNPLTLIYIRVEDELIRRDGQLASVDGSYQPAQSVLNSNGPFGNWPMDWCTGMQWYAQNSGPGQWAIEYHCGIPMDATGYDGGSGPTLASNWTTAYNRYFAAVQNAGLGFKSLIAARAAGGAPAYIQPIKPASIVYQTGSESYLITMPVGWTGPTNQSQLNTVTASIRGQVALRFLNGQRPVTYVPPIAPATQQSYLLARGRYPSVGWDNTGTFSLVQWIGVTPQTFTFIGMKRRKTGRIPFVARGRARVSRP
jgi:hypothetical protein